MFSLKPIKYFSLLIGFIVLPTSANADGFGFMTPSGNVYCNGYVSNGGGIGCTLIKRSGAPAKPKPNSCKGYWGHEFEIEGKGRATMTCGKKPSNVDYTDIASYGLSADFGSITCKSERKGFTCRNKSGHGFFLSRKIQKIF